MLKGLYHDLVSIVAPKVPTIAKSFIADCKSYEGLQSARLFYSSFKRLPVVTPSNYTFTDLASLSNAAIDDTAELEVAG